MGKDSIHDWSTSMVAPLRLTSTATYSYSTTSTPGIVGLLGTILGKDSVNIANMSLIVQSVKVLR